MKKTSLLALFCTWAFIALAQQARHEVVSSAGGSYQGTDVSIDWTLGECITETLNASGNSLSQGFHQASYTLTSIFEHKELMVDLKVYPNPTPDILYISTGQAGQNIKLTDALGKVLLNKQLTGNSGQVSLSAYRYSTYFLVITNPEGEKIKTFKIVKSM